MLSLLTVNYLEVIHFVYDISDSYSDHFFFQQQITDCIKCDSHEIKPCEFLQIYL